MVSQFELRLGLIIPFSCLDLNFTFLSSFDSRSHVWFDLIEFRFSLFLFLKLWHGRSWKGKDRERQHNIQVWYQVRWKVYDGVFVFFLFDSFPHLFFVITSWLSLRFLSCCLLLHVHGWWMGGYWRIPWFSFPFAVFVLDFIFLFVFFFLLLLLYTLTYTISPWLQ